MTIASAISSRFGRFGKVALTGALLGTVTAVTIASARSRQHVTKNPAKHPSLSPEADVAVMELSRHFTFHGDIVTKLSNAMAHLEHLAAAPVPGDTRSAMQRVVDAHRYARIVRTSLTELDVVSEGNGAAEAALASSSSAIEEIVGHALFNISL